MSKLLQRNKLVYSLLVSVGILAIGFIVNHNKISFVILGILLFTFDINNHYFHSKPFKKYTLAKFGILAFLLGDLFYTFYLQYYCPIDGDLAEAALPSQQYSYVLSDPFGFSILFHHARYDASNRFFLHWTAYQYFNRVPLIFQHFTNPISSIYLASALSKMLIKGLLIYVLGAYISGSYKIFNRQFLLAALLITPLMQTCGYVWSLGVIDPTVTGPFAYTLSTCLLGLFFLPFFMHYHHQQKLELGFSGTLLLVLLTIVAVFFGPLNAPLIFIICPSLLFYHWWCGLSRNNLPFTQNAIVSFRQLPTSMSVTFILALVFSIYSFYIGKFNGENFLSTSPLSLRYKRLPLGIASLYLNKAMGILSLVILANIIILFKKRKNAVARKILWLFPCIVSFCVVYTLLLPLGGYRSYRPYTVRRDTMEPVMLAIFLFYGISSVYILKHINIPNQKKIYSGSLAILLLHFAVTNTNNKFDNSCERNALQQLAASNEKIVQLSNDCDVLHWGRITDYKDSKTVTGYLLKLNVLHQEKYFYQK